MEPHCFATIACSASIRAIQDIQCSWRAFLNKSYYFSSEMLGRLVFCLHVWSICHSVWQWPGDSIVDIDSKISLTVSGLAWGL